MQKTEGASTVVKGNDCCDSRSEVELCKEMRGEESQVQAGVMEGSAAWGVIADLIG